MKKETIGYKILGGVLVKEVATNSILTLKKDGEESYHKAIREQLGYLPSPEYLLKVREINSDLWWRNKDHVVYDVTYIIEERAMTLEEAEEGLASLRGVWTPEHLKVYLLAPQGPWETTVSDGFPLRFLRELNLPTQQYIRILNNMVVVTLGRFDENLNIAKEEVE